MLQGTGRKRPKEERLGQNTEREGWQGIPRIHPHMYRWAKVRRATVMKALPALFVMSSVLINELGAISQNEEVVRIPQSLRGIAQTGMNTNIKPVREYVEKYGLIDGTRALLRSGDRSYVLLGLELAREHRLYMLGEDILRLVRDAGDTQVQQAAFILLPYSGVPLVQVLGEKPSPKEARRFAEVYASSTRMADFWLARRICREIADLVEKGKPTREAAVQILIASARLRFPWPYREDYVFPDAKLDRLIKKLEMSTFEQAQLFAGRGTKLARDRLAQYVDSADPKIASTAASALVAWNDARGIVPLAKLLTADKPIEETELTIAARSLLLLSVKAEPIISEAISSPEFANLPALPENIRQAVAAGKIHDAVEALRVFFRSRKFTKQHALIGAYLRDWIISRSGSITLDRETNRFVLRKTAENE